MIEETFQIGEKSRNLDNLFSIFSIESKIKDNKTFVILHFLRNRQSEKVLYFFGVTVATLQQPQVSRSVVCQIVFENRNRWYHAKIKENDKKIDHRKFIYVLYFVDKKWRHILSLYYATNILLAIKLFTSLPDV